MEDYPGDYVAPIQPLVVLSGLTTPDPKDYLEHPLQKNGFRIQSDSPSITGHKAEQLLHAFQTLQSTGRPTSGERIDSMRFKFKPAGRQYQLPARKASPQASLADFQLDNPLGSPVTSSSHTLHSPLSPLSPGSPLYPDGLMTPVWVSKHRDVIPCHFISFFCLETDPDKTTLNDNRLRQEILSLKSSLDNSRYRIRFAVVIVSETNPEEDRDLESRVENIRKATNIDPKHAFFFTPLNVTSSESSAFVSTLLSAIRPNAVEYYRSLTQHARRKRDKRSASGSSPPPTPGIHQQLIRPAWQSRDEMKLGLFAEMRLEPEVAARHYSNALEHLWGRSGVFESMDSWSPRFNEARQFSDAMFLRLIRCLLCNHLHTSAVRTWVSYRLQVRDTLVRKGKSTSSYSWKAWEARHAEVMAQLIEEQLGQDDELESITLSSYPNEKFQNAEEYIAPWQNLHRSGYWWLLASKFTEERRSLAQAIPAEDRIPPGQSPAGNVAMRQETYDFYLCPEPHIETKGLEEGGTQHSVKILEALKHASDSFARADLLTLGGFAAYIAGKELVARGDVDAAHTLLLPFWTRNRWRNNGWWKLLGTITLLTHRSSPKGSASHIGTLWELYNRDLPHNDDVEYDIMTDMKIFSKDDDTTKQNLIELNDRSVHSFIRPVISFKGPEGFAGSETKFQLLLPSHAHEASLPIRLSSILIALEGPVRQLVIVDKPDSNHGELKAATRVIDVHFQSLGADDKVLQGSGNLEIYPTQTIVLDCQMIAREPGKIMPKSCSLIMETPETKLIYEHDLQDQTPAASWCSMNSTQQPSWAKASFSSNTLLVHPKPPKVELRYPKIRDAYYTSEETLLSLEIVNEEEDAADIELEILLLGGSEGSLRWSDNSSPPAAREDGICAINTSVGKLAPGAKQQRQITILFPEEPRELVLETKVVYRIRDDPTPVLKVQPFELSVTRPLEANFALHSAYHPNPWPSYFTFQPSSAEANNPQGLTTRWKLEAKIASFAVDAIVLKSASVQVLKITAGARFETFEQAPELRKAIDLSPKTQVSLSFMLDLSKQDLDERRATGIDAAVEVFWQRPGADEDATPFRTFLAMPHLTIPSSEPRCLAHEQPIDQAKEGDDEAIALDYTIENPSTHFLSFNVTMDPDEDFAFAGPQNLNINLIPLSRQTISYTFYPISKDLKMMRPQLTVLDTYFQKTLKPVPSGALRSDDKGLIIPIKSTASKSKP